MYQTVKRIFLIVLLSSAIYAQTKLDSLQSSISERPDSIKIRFLNEFCRDNRNTNPKLALQAGQEALKIAQINNYKNLVASSLNLIGVIYRNLGNYDKSIEFYKNALKVAESVKDSTQIGFAYTNLGGLYRLEGNNNLALEFTLRSLTVFEKLKMKEGIAYCSINIGLIYYRQQDYSKAQEYLDYSLKLRGEINDRRGRAQTLNLMGNVQAAQNKLNEAMQYYGEAEKQYTALSDKKGLAEVWTGIGRIYYAKKDFAAAAKYYQHALDMSNQISFANGQLTNLINLGLINAQQNNFVIADNNFSNALKIAGEIKDIYSQLECYKSIAEYNEIKEDYKTALFYTKKYNLLEDSVNNNDISSLMNEREARYKQEKTEREIFILQKQVELDKKESKYWLIIFFLGVVSILITYWKFHSKKVANLKLQKINAMKDKFFNIIAHDLKNPFNAIFGCTTILIEDFDTLSDEEKIRFIRGIDTSGRESMKLLENLLEWARSQTGRIKYKPKFLSMTRIINQTFSLLEGTAKNKNISLISNITEDLSVYADEEMLKTILRNLVSNAIKFTVRGGKVLISAIIADGTKQIIVEDTGIGMSEETKNKLFQIEEITTSQGTNGEPGTGLGLLLCKEFIERNNGTICVESEIGKGSKFIFTLPIVK